MALKKSFQSNSNQNKKDQAFVYNQLLHEGPQLEYPFCYGQQNENYYLVQKLNQRKSKDFDSQQHHSATRKKSSGFQRKLKRSPHKVLQEGDQVKKIRLKSKQRSQSNQEKGEERDPLNKKKKDKKITLPKPMKFEEKKGSFGNYYFRRKKKSNNDLIKPNNKQIEKIKRLLNSNDSKTKFKFDISNAKNYLRKMKIAEQRKEKPKEKTIKKS